MNAEVTHRLHQLERLALRTNDTVDGVARLLRHPSVLPYLDRSIHLDAGGARLGASAFTRHVDRIYAAHNLQTDYDRRILESKWRSPVLGRVDAWDLLRLLHFTIDHTDRFLMYTSQFVHCLQVYAGVRRSVVPRAMRRDLEDGALIHDLGKTLTLFGELDANVDCMNRVVGFRGDGLDGLIAQWNHDEFAYQRLRDHPRVSQGVRDILRFHSLREASCVGKPVPETHRVRARGNKEASVTRADWQALANHTSVRDRRRAELVVRFSHFDAFTKRVTDRVPLAHVVDARRAVRALFPEGIVW